MTIKNITKIGFCKTCGAGYEKIGKGTGSRKYCKTCSINSKRESNRKCEPKRPKRNEYLRNKMQKYRLRGTVQDNKDGILGINMVGKPPEGKPTDKEWNDYHNKIKKMKQESMGGYQDYHVDDDNPY